MQKVLEYHIFSNRELHRKDFIKEKVTHAMIEEDKLHYKFRSGQKGYQIPDNMYRNDASIALEASTRGLKNMFDRIDDLKAEVEVLKFDKERSEQGPDFFLNEKGELQFVFEGVDG